MKKVLIFAGGTGSIALQTGLHQLYGNFKVCNKHIAYNLKPL